MSLLSAPKSSTFAVARGLLLAAAFTSVNSVTANAANDVAFFNSVEGQWSGAGQIVAGPYAKTRFTCKLNGETPGRAGMKLSGTCRVGLFSQPIEATITKRGKGYKGAYLDGAKGKGLDITGGRLRGKHLILTMKRKQLNGQIVANMKSKTKLAISINVNVGNQIVPFISLTMKRTGSASRTSLLAN